MRRIFIVVVTLLLVGAATPAFGNGPPTHFTEDVTGDVFVCDTATYTITSGEIKFVIHEGAAAQGNTNLTGTVTPVKVVAVDEDGNQYSLVGALWFGSTFNANTGGFQTTFTGKLQIVSEGGGSADSVNLTFHITLQPNNFVMNEFDFGTCEVPA